jgi:hypothetical protein
MCVFVGCDMRGANARCGRGGKTTEGESVEVDGGWRVANSLVRQEARNCLWAIGRVCGREGATVSRVIFVGCAGGIDDGA